MHALCSMAENGSLDLSDVSGDWALVYLPKIMYDQGAPTVTNVFAGAHVIFFLTMKKGK